MNIKSKKILIIVESPNKVKKISEFLGKNYIVRASYGHIMDLQSNKKNKLGINIKNNFEPKYCLLHDKKDKVGSIIDATTGVSEIYIATDPDREGEAIAFHLRYCLESAGLPIKRVLFNEITKNAIKKAVKNPIDLNENLYNAQQARRVLDRIVGFMVSPFLSQSLNSSKLSAGRVQSVAVRLVVDKEDEIKSFIKEEFWDIYASLAKSSDLNDKFEAKLIKKVKNKKEASNISKALGHDSFCVDSVDKAQQNKAPQPPLITSKLQQLASSKLNFSVSKTMRLAQSLYESGMITYMRTDSTRVSPEAVVDANKYLTNKGFKLPNKLNKFKSKKSSQDAHEAIRPTSVSVEPDAAFLEDNQRELYRLIWESFLASQMTDAIFNIVKVKIITKGGFELEALGKTLVDKGWMSIISSAKFEDSYLPDLNKADILSLVDPKITTKQKFTQPPARFTEGTLVKKLESRGIGRPSTYGDIISKIKNKGYVELKNKTYYGTNLGKKVTDNLCNYFKFLEYDYTADMENKLDDISVGKLTYFDMLNSFYDIFKKELRTAYYTCQDNFNIICEKCENVMLLKHGKFGFYMQCVDLDCRTTKSCDIVDGEPQLKDNFSLKIVPEVDCPKCGSQMHEVNAKFNMLYYCVNSPKCDGKRKVPFGKKCPECNNELFLNLVKDVVKLSCMGYPECTHNEDIPKGYNIKWVNPEIILNNVKLKKSINKALNLK